VRLWAASGARRGVERAGYAVLSFDKRTCGPFNGCADNDYPVLSRDLVIEGAAASGKPLLALFGDYDWNVLAAEAELWRGTFAQGDQPEHEVAVLPCVTHALNCITEQDLARLRPAHIGCHVHGSVIDAISSFLGQH
jgi:hypothetical protein